MIVLDEQIKDRHIRHAIESWYRGSVIDILALRAGSVIKDDNIPHLLIAARQPTFVTINVDDFWRKISPHPKYCIVAIDLSQGDVDGLPSILRQVLSLPEFATKASRMGRIIRAQSQQIRYYGQDQQIHII